MPDVPTDEYGPGGSIKRAAEGVLGAVYQGITGEDLGAVPVPEDLPVGYAQLPQAEDRVAPGAPFQELGLEGDVEELAGIEGWFTKPPNFLNYAEKIENDPFATSEEREYGAFYVRALNDFWSRSLDGENVWRSEAYFYDYGHFVQMVRLLIASKHGTGKESGERFTSAEPPSRSSLRPDRPEPALGGKTEKRKRPKQGMNKI
jgi:hypothetical protein